ncbi:hypothetical protein Q5752_000702 [Cryptotrichosporon argae]
MTAKHPQSALDGARRSLQRAAVYELSQGVLDQAFALALNPPADAATLEVTSFLVVFFRQLHAAVTAGPSHPTVEDVHTKLGLAFRPGGVFATTLLAGLASPIKPHMMRAADALTAACRLADVLPPPHSSTSETTYLLGPLFVDIANAGMAQRSHLVALSILVEHVPSSLIPGSMLNGLLGQLGVADGASVRGSIIANLLDRRQRRDDADASESDQYRCMLEPILPLLVTEQPLATSQNIDRYLLPAVFRRVPASLPTMLRMLDEHSGQNGAASFAAWVTVASLGVSSGIVNLVDIPTETLHGALAHADDKIRIRAFQAVTSAKDLLDPAVLELVKQSFRYNEVLPSPSGRTDLAGVVHAFLTQLHVAQTAARRVARKNASKTGPVQCAEAFHAWLLDDFLQPSIASARRHPALRTIFALKLLLIYLEVFSDEETKCRVFTEDRVDVLIACQASEFSDIRVQARSILALAPSLPGYESLDSPKTRLLLDSAIASLSHPRQTQAEAGRAAYCIVFTKVVPNHGEQAGERALQMVRDLVDYLERNLQHVERDLASGIVKHPLHGPLSALSDVLACLDLRTAEAQHYWRDTLRDLRAMIDRVWAAVRPVISLSAKPSESSAAHEIAKAYEVLADGDDEAEDVMDHTNLLSGCWRAMKEAADLLATIVALPFLQAKDSQTVWAAEDVDRSGRTFLLWLSEIRHRGTFAKIAPALGRLVDALRSVPGLHSTVSAWIDRELEAITTDRHSTTRRSAALPYSILAIVCHSPVLLDRAVDRLTELARVEAASSDVTQVHAMNILKIVLLDARQNKVYTKYLERTLLVALEAFGSANWSVRNVGLLLFSTLANRSLSGGRGQDVFASRASLAARPTLAVWSAAYPAVVPFITRHLSASATRAPSSLATLSPLFPILIIVRSLKWSADGEALAAGLRDVVEPYLASSEWQVRQVAAQAFSSLIAPGQAVDQAVAVATIAGPGCMSRNEQHGRLILLNHLIRDVILFDDVSADDKQNIDKSLRALCQLEPGSPAVTAAVLDCVVAFHTMAAASSALLECAGQLSTASMQQPASVPGSDILRTAAAAVCLLRPSEPIIADLLKSADEDLQLAALDTPHCTSAIAAGVVEALAALAVSAKSSNAVRIKALEVIIDCNVRSVSDVVREQLADSLTVTIRSSRCVPLREAALPVLGWCLHARDSFVARAGDVTEMVDRNSHEDQSEPSRTSALHCLRHIGNHLFDRSIPAPVTAGLQRCLLRLLQDDDEDIRIGAAAIVSAQLGLARPVVQCKAVELWWAWLNELLADPAAREAWEAWLVDRAAPASIESDLLRLLPKNRPSDVLFHVEPSNIFRDDRVDMAHAATLLDTVPAWRENLPDDDTAAQPTPPPLALANAPSDPAGPSPTWSCNFEQYLDLPPSAATAHHPLSLHACDQSDSMSPRTLRSSSPVRRPSDAERNHKRRARPPIRGPKATPGPVAVSSETHFHALVLSLTARYYRDLARLVQGTEAGIILSTPASEGWRAVAQSVQAACEQLVPHAPTGPTASTSAGGSAATPRTPSSASSMPPITPLTPTSARSPSLDAEPSAADATAMPGADLTTSLPSGQLLERPPAHTGAWTVDEEARLRQLAQQSSIVSGAEADWTWVAQRFGPGRNRRQLKLKATALGLKESSSRKISKFAAKS